MSNLIGPTLSEVHEFVDSRIEGEAVPVSLSHPLCALENIVRL